MVHEVKVPSGRIHLPGELVLPPEAGGIVLFAHGSGSSRLSSRNQYVARVLQEACIGTLLFDLLTSEEEVLDQYSAALRFDIGLLAQRLADATRWLLEREETRSLKVGYFGASTGGGAALVAAAQFGDALGAVVSRGGRPDLAGPALPQVTAPTLLIVGGLDTPVIRLNRLAFEKLGCVKSLEIVEGASHLFEEPGKLAIVAQLARDWFAKHLARPHRA